MLDRTFGTMATEATKLIRDVALIGHCRYFAELQVSGPMRQGPGTAEMQKRLLMEPYRSQYRQLCQTSSGLESTTSRARHFAARCLDIPCPGKMSTTNIPARRPEVPRRNLALPQLGDIPRMAQESCREIHPRDGTKRIPLRPPSKPPHDPATLFGSKGSDRCVFGLAKPRTIKCPSVRVCLQHISLADN